MFLKVGAQLASGMAIEVRVVKYLFDTFFTLVIAVFIKLMMDALIGTVNRSSVRDR